MSSYSVFLPSYSVGTDCYKELPYVTRKYGKNAVVIGGKTAMLKARPELEAAIEGTDLHILDYIWYGGTSICDKEIWKECRCYRWKDCHA